MRRVSHKNAATTYPVVYQWALKSLKARLPFLGNSTMEDVLVERGEMITFRVVAYCYVNNMDQVSSLGGNHPEKVLEEFVKEEVDFTFVDEIVGMYVSILLAQKGKVFSAK